MIINKSFKISGTGCALVDYLYKPINFKDNALIKYLSKNPGDGGLEPGKLVFKEEFEKYAKEDYLQVRNLITKGQEPVALNIGGPSIVSLIHAAQMLSDSTAEVYFYGCKGTDDAGIFITEKLKLTPLKIGQYKTGSQFTPFTDVLSDPGFDGGNGERIFINNIGAAWVFRAEDLDNSFFQSDMIVFGGTALVPNIHKSLEELLKKAKEHNAITVVNTVFDFLSEKNNSSKRWPLGGSLETYRYIDLLITNMEEALRLSGTATVEGVMDFFNYSGVGALIITHGSNSLYFYAHNSLFGKIPPTTLPVSVRVKTELRQDAGKAGDTTGCGDNFAGGVIASIAKQLIKKPDSQQVNFKNAIAFGIVSGGYACFYNGGTYYEDFPGQKEQLLNTYYQEYLAQVGLNDTT